MTDFLVMKMLVFLYVCFLMMGGSLHCKWQKYMKATNYVLFPLHV